MSFTDPVPLVHADRGLTFEEVKQMGLKIIELNENNIIIKDERNKKSNKEEN